MARKFLHSRFLLALMVSLSACGGGGGVGSAGSVAAPNPPAPPPGPPPSPPSTITTTLTPLPPTNGLIAGTFNTLAVVERFDGTNLTLAATNPGDVQISIDPTTKTYTIVTSIAGLPPQQAFDLGHVAHGACCPDTISEFGNHVVKKDSAGTIVAEYDATEGRSKDDPFTPSPAGTNESHYYLTYNLGLRYVSLGFWQQINWTSVGGNLWTGDDNSNPNKIYFVNGERTPAGNIPPSGTATYQLAALIVEPPTVPVGNSGNLLTSMQSIQSPDLPSALTLTADFGASSIAADLNVPQQSYIAGDSLGGYDTYYNLGVRATGSAPFSASGDFTIPLQGQILPDPAGDGGALLTGNVLGAFFGPQAENIGGLLQLTPAASPTLTIPFVAKQ